MTSGAQLVFSGYTSGVISLSSNASSATGMGTFLTCDITIAVPAGLFLFVRFSETETAAGAELFKMSAFQKQFSITMKEDQGPLCKDCLKRPPVAAYSRSNTVRVEISVMHFEFPFSFRFNFTAVSEPVVPKLEVIFTSYREGRGQANTIIILRAWSEFDCLTHSLPSGRHMTSLAKHFPSTFRTSYLFLPEF